MVPVALRTEHLRTDQMVKLLGSPCARRAQFRLASSSTNQNSRLVNWTDSQPKVVLLCCCCVVAREVGSFHHDT